MDSDKDKIQVGWYSWAPTRTKYRWGGTLGQRQEQNTGRVVLLGYKKNKLQAKCYSLTTKKQIIGGMVPLGNGNIKILVYLAPEQLHNSTRKFSVFLF